MRKISSILAVSLTFAVVVSFSAIAKGANNKHVKSATAVGEAYGDGEKITAAILEYDQPIENTKLSASAFSVTDRTITKVYANTAAAKASQGVNGRYVVIELSPADPGADVLVGGPGKDNGGPGGQGGPRGEGGPGGPGAQRGSGEPGGPGGQGAPGHQSGPQAKRMPVKATVAQVGAVTTTTGDVYPADPTPFDTDKAVNLVIDDFKQFTYKDPETGDSFGYNLFTPENYDKSKSYPLVLFMHDASVSGNDKTDRTLIQGLGAVVWAGPSDQARHPAFVVAPVLDGKVSADTVVRFVNDIAGRFSIDKNRMYTTGQSAGCIRSIAIDEKYPNFFAASLLVAGQPEGDVQAVSAMSNQNIWIIVSEGDTRAYPGMNAAVAVWEKGGTKISKAVWNARDNDAQMTVNARKMISEGNNIKYTMFLKGTTLPEGHPPDNEHMQTWKVAYTITAVRDWLFTQTRAAR